MVALHKNRKQCEAGLFTLAAFSHPHILWTRVLSATGLLHPHRRCHKTPSIPLISTQPQSLWSQQRQSPHYSLWLIFWFISVGHVTDTKYVFIKTRQFKNYQQNYSIIGVRNAVSFCEESWSMFIWRPVWKYFCFKINYQRRSIPTSKEIKLDPNFILSSVQPSIIKPWSSWIIFTLDWSTKFSFYKD